MIDKMHVVEKKLSKMVFLLWMFAVDHRHGL
jgi:hypothetical protein